MQEPNYLKVMSKCSNKKRLKQLQSWLSNEIYYGKGKNNPKSKNYVSRKNDKQLNRKTHIRKDDENTVREDNAKRLQEFVNANEKEGRYYRKGKSFRNSISLH